jgi:hypothetical protein
LWLRIIPSNTVRKSLGEANHRIRKGGAKTTNTDADSGASRSISAQMATIITAVGAMSIWAANFVPPYAA